MRYELGSYIPEDDILYIHRLGNHKSYIFHLSLSLAEVMKYRELRRMGSSGMLRCVALVRTDVWKNLAPPSSG
jgi:hypothetical protein